VLVLGNCNTQSDEKKICTAYTYFLILDLLMLVLEVMLFVTFACPLNLFHMNI